MRSSGCHASRTTRDRAARPTARPGRASLRPSSVTADADVHPEPRNVRLWDLTSLRRLGLVARGHLEAGGSPCAKEESHLADTRFTIREVPRRTSGSATIWSLSDDQRPW